MFRRELEVREPDLDSLTWPLFLCFQEQFNSLFAQSCFGGGMSRSDSGGKGTSSGPVNYSPFFTLQHYPIIHFYATFLAEYDPRTTQKPWRLVHP